MDVGGELAVFEVIEHLVEACFFHVDQLSTQREDGLCRTIPALFGRATSGVTFDNEEFRFGGIFFGAVS